MLKEREQILKSIQALAVKVLLSGALCEPTARYLITPALSLQGAVWGMDGLLVHAC